MSQTTRRGYHHGDLANALVDEALSLARQGGPEAVVLREAARRAGVSATAAYRHFTDQRDLLRAVKERAQDNLIASMETELAASEPLADPAAEAFRQLRALGAAYVNFALQERGLYLTAFCFTGPVRDPFSSRAYGMLNATLDRLVTTGAIPPERRQFLDVFAWSAVHGLSMLLLDGEFAVLGDKERRALVERTLDATVAGVANG